MSSYTRVPKTYDGTSNRPNPDVELALSRRDTPFNIIDFPAPLSHFNNYEQSLAFDGYNDALNTFFNAVGSRQVGVGLNGYYISWLQVALLKLQEIINKEKGHEKELEELCETLIRDYFQLSENDLKFNLKLISTSIKTKSITSKEKLKEEKEEKKEEYDDLASEIGKRRIINALIQGHAVDGVFIYNRAIERLGMITADPFIHRAYNKYFSIALLGYWQNPDRMMDSIMGTDGDGNAMGKTRLDSTTNPPTINAEAVAFPILVHETIKGVMEFLSKERDPKNLKRTEKAIEIADQVVHEIWDIRLGPTIWKRLENLFPDAVKTIEEKKKLKYYIYSNIANLPANEFLPLMNEIMEQTVDARTLIAAMYYDLCIMIDGEEVPEEEYNFRERMDDIMKKQAKAI